MSTVGITQNLNELAGGNSSVPIAQNPNAVLKKDDFMKLLLVQLQHQDPTEPMDTATILTQTSQLATLESATNTNQTMEKLVAQLSGNMDMSALSAIGKMASLGSNAVTLPENGLARFEIYFQNEIQTGTLTISDKNGNIVRDISLDEQTGKSGVLAFEWDGTDNSGNPLPVGFYSVNSEYLDVNNEQQKTQFGIYPVESVRFEEGMALMKLGSFYVPMEYIVEFF